MTHRQKKQKTVNKTHEKKESVTKIMQTWKEIHYHTDACCVVHDYDMTSISYIFQSGGPIILLIQLFDQFQNRPQCGKQKLQSIVD